MGLGHRHAPSSSVGVPSLSKSIRCGASAKSGHQGNRGLGRITKLAKRLQYFPSGQSNFQRCWFDAPKSAGFLLEDLSILMIAYTIIYARWVTRIAPWRQRSFNFGTAFMASDEQACWRMRRWVWTLWSCEPWPKIQSGDRTLRTFVARSDQSVQSKIRGLVNDHGPSWSERWAELSPLGEDEGTAHALRIDHWEGNAVISLYIVISSYLSCDALLGPDHPECEQLFLENEDCYQRTLCTEVLFYLLRLLTFWKN